MMFMGKSSWMVWLCLIGAAAVTGMLIGCGGGESTEPASTPAATTAPQTDEGTPTEAGAAAEPAESAAGAPKKETATPAAESEASSEAGAWGTIKGRIVYGGKQPVKPKVLVKKGDKSVKDAPRCCERQIESEELVVNPENKGIKWAVVYLLKPKAIHPDLKEPPSEPAELGQEFCIFIPHVLALRQGQKLRITASDPGVSHNTNIVGFRNAPFNRILPPPPGEGKKSEMDGPNLVAERLNLNVQCNVHPWMSAKIWVFDHPYFAVTGEDGSFELKNVPSGTNKLVIWQEKLLFKKTTRKGMDVAVKPGQTTDLGDIVLGAP